jgi:uncharacterized protein
MAVRLDNLKISESEQRSLESGYLYKDVKFDLTMNRFARPELYSKTAGKDIDEIQDASAVLNSVKNILTTTPGQKILNPLFGLDFRSYLFEPVNSTTSFFIAYFIYNNLGVQEPRVKLEGVAVDGSPDQNQYDININFSVPNLDIYGLSLNATLNTDGYVIV